MQRYQTQGSKLMLTNLQNASDFDNQWVRKISTSKRFQVTCRIIHVSKTFVESCLNTRRNVLMTSDANKTVYAAEKSTFFSHSELQKTGGVCLDNDKEDQRIFNTLLIKLFWLINISRAKYQF